jgi:formylglycine-generating enzyme required for sulfatase activity
MNTKIIRIPTLLLIICLCSSSALATEYKNLEDAVVEAESLIAKQYNSKIANKLAIKNLEMIVFNKKLSNKEKIDKVVNFIKQRKKIKKTLKNGLKIDKKHVNNMTIPDLEIKLVYVAPGNFHTDSNNNDSAKKLVHGIRISEGYWIGKHEITQSQYETIMGYNPSDSKGSDKPVEKVNWNDAVKFCKKLTARERTAGRLPSGCEYRLPTEAEWEFAARGGSKSRGYKYSGSNSIDSIAWYKINAGKQMHKIGTKSANELDIHDMSGNVWEWCNYGYGKYKSTNAIYPISASSDSEQLIRGGVLYGKYKSTNAIDASSYPEQVIRGGGWLDNPNSCHVAFRFPFNASTRCTGLGFRILRTLVKQ